MTKKKAPESWIAYAELEAIAFLKAFPHYSQPVLIDRPGPVTANEYNSPL